MMKHFKLFLPAVVGAALLLGGCATSETMSTSERAPTAPGTETGAAAAGGIDNGNGINSGFGGPESNTGPAGVPTYPPEPIGRPYGGR